MDWLKFELTWLRDWLAWCEREEFRQTLRCEVREKMIEFLQKEHPEALPTARQISFVADGGWQAADKPAHAPRRNGPDRSFDRDRPAPH